MRYWAMWEKVCKNWLTFSLVCPLHYDFGAPPPVGGICFPHPWVWSHLMACCSKSDIMPVLSQASKSLSQFCSPIWKLAQSPYKKFGVSLLDDERFVAHLLSFFQLTASQTQNRVAQLTGCWVDEWMNPSEVERTVQLNPAKTADSESWAK